MSTPQFAKLVADVQTIKAQFMRSTDPVERSELLVKLGVVVQEIDSLIIEQMTKLQLWQSCIGERRELCSMKNQRES